MVEFQESSFCIKRRTLGVVFGFVAVMLVGDLILARVGAPRVYGSTNEALRKWDLLESQKLTPDVVFLGCSYESYGIAPSVVETEIEYRTHKRITGFNLAASASSLLTQYLLVRELLDNGVRPYVVYLGVAPNSTDIGLSSWMSNGLRVFAEPRDLPLVWPGGRSLVADATAASMFQSYHFWNDWRLVTKRLLIHAPIEPPSRAVVDARGWERWVGQQSPTDPLYIDRPQHIDFGNVNGAAAGKAVRLLRDSGVTVRLIEMPLSNQAWELLSSAHRAAYRRFVTELSQQTDIALTRPPATLVGDEDFFDGIHLTRRSAEVFSRWLSSDVAVALSENRRFRSATGNETILAEVAEVPN